MAKVNFETATANEELQQNSSSNGVSFFSLRNDNDYAIVRFTERTTNDFDILSVHDINVGGKYRKLNCLRANANDSLDPCPACKAGLKLVNRFFIHLIKYDVDDQGNIVPIPMVWERSLRFANQLRDLINTYGDLPNSIFKITRHGAAGDMQTTYSIMYCPPTMYAPEQYPAHPELFDNFSVLGTIVLDKNTDEINTFLSTGAFPQVATSQGANAIPPQSTYSTGQSISTMSQPASVPPNAVPNTTASVPPTTQPVYDTQLPWETPNQVQKPIRTY